MNIKKIYSLDFSPAGSTGRIVRMIADSIAKHLGLQAEYLDFTLPARRSRAYTFGADELVIVGSPTYAGKLPNKILPDFQTKLRGSRTPAVAVVTYGNRAYDNSLAELCAVLEEDGFGIAAAAAFVSRHVFTDKLAQGRPNEQDKVEIYGFALKIAEKIRQAANIESSVSVPGDSNAPYYRPLGTNGEPVNFLKAKPRVDKAVCDNCGLCASLCPMGIIDPRDASDINGSCIKCCACILNCPNKAIAFADEGFVSHVDMLETNYKDNKANAFFLD